MQASGQWHIEHPSRGDNFSIWSLADWHLFNAACLVDRLKEDIEKIRLDPNALWTGVGDYAEFISPSDPRFNPDDVSSEVLASDLGRIGPKYIKAVLDLMRPIAHKCLGLGFGNHEFRYMKEKEQQNLHGWLCLELAKFAGHEIPDLGYSALFDLVFHRHPNIKRWRGPYRTASPPRFGDVFTLRIYQHHGSGAARTSGGKLNGLVAKMREFEADLYFVAHAHEKQDQELPVIGANRDCTHLTEIRRVGVRTGSYLRTYAQGQTGYGEMAGFPPSCLGARAVEICPNERRITKIVL